MTVYCVIPVHNRVEETEMVLQCLEAQDYLKLRTIVVDDGSTDGTADTVQQQYPEVHLLAGGGNLWWAGAMHRGLTYILSQASEDDYVLFQNNDTQFQPDYVRTLVEVSRAHGNAVVGSILKDVVDKNRIVSLGPRIDYWRTRIEEVYTATVDSSGTIEKGADREQSQMPEVVEMDALSGRGTLYPRAVFRRVGSVRHRLLPHYMADYEIAIRAKHAGFRTVVSTRAVVWTGREVSGIDPKRASTTARLLGRKSRSNILDTIMFFSLCGPAHLRVSAPARVVLYRMWGAARRRLIGCVS